MSAMEGSHESSSMRDLSIASEDTRSSSSTAPTEKPSTKIDEGNFVDVEVQLGSKSKPAVAPEYNIPTKTKYIYLGLYFILNLVLTLYNKAVLGHFAFPWLLTTLHTGCAFLGCNILLLCGYFKITKLTTSENLTMVAFSALFTLNVAVSNVSLKMVSVPFHQIMRSTCPVFTILIYRFFYNRTYSEKTYASLIPVVLGVGLATYGDYYFTIIGLFLTLWGVILSSIKTVASNRLMTGNLALPALEILLRMSPLAAFQSLLYAMITGEASAFLQWVADGNLTPTYSFALAGNGFLAFLLNVSSFYTNKLAGALTVTVCANVKQCLTITLGIALFDIKVGAWNGIGMLVTLIGGAIYSKVELQSKRDKDLRKVRPTFNSDGGNDRKTKH